MLPRWEMGMDTIRTSIATGIDFWKAFSIGITLAVTFVSFYQLFTIAKDKRAEAAEKLRNSGGLIKLRYVNTTTVINMPRCAATVLNIWAVEILTFGRVQPSFALQRFIPSYWQKSFFRRWSAFGCFWFLSSSRLSMLRLCPLSVRDLMG